MSSRFFRWSSAGFGVACVLVLGAFLFMEYLRAPEPLGADQGLFATIAQGILRGSLPYREVWDHKPPGVLYTYAAAFTVFGETVGGLWLFEGACLLLTGLIAFLLVRGVFGRWAGLAAAVLLLAGLWAPGWGRYWTRAQAETFILLPMLAASWATRRGRSSSAAAFWCGVLTGVMTLYKLPVICFALAWPLAWWAGNAPRTWVRRAVLMGLGIIIVWVPVAAYFVLAGIWGDFWDAAYWYSAVFASFLAENTTWTRTVTRLFVEPARNMPVLVPAAGIGLVAVAVGRREERAWLLPWFVVALLTVFMQRHLAAYHLFLLLPPLAVAGACGVTTLGGMVRRGTSRTRILAVAALAALAVLLVATDVPQWRRGYGPHWAYRTGRLNRPAFFRTFDAPPFFPAVEEAAAEYVRANTRPQDGILVWGFYPGLYFRADRHPVTRFPFHHFLLTDEPLSRRYGDLEQRRASFLDRLGLDPPALILIGLHDPNGFEANDSYTQMMQFPAFRQLITAHYTPGGTLGNLLICRRRGPETAPGPR